MLNGGIHTRRTSVAATISARTADECDKSFGQELLPEEDRGRLAQVRAKKDRLMRGPISQFWRPRTRGFP